MAQRILFINIKYYKHYLLFEITSLSFDKMFYFNYTLVKYTITEYCKIHVIIHSLYVYNFYVENEYIFMFVKNEYILETYDRKMLILSQDKLKKYIIRVFRV